MTATPSVVSDWSPPVSATTLSSTLWSDWSAPVSATTPSAITRSDWSAPVSATTLADAALDDAPSHTYGFARLISDGVSTAALLANGDSAARINSPVGEALLDVGLTT